jgi:50S ribosomal protein L16 3-hydroxylase
MLLRPAGLSADGFLRRYWQKQPLLVRAALRGRAGIVDREQLFEFATREDLESRLVLRGSGRWEVRHGPFSRRELARLPRRDWTLLIQGIDHVLPAASELLQAFSFIPIARLDDVMVSYAPPGGGVGPHFDSYDVFLLQASGARRWRISRQRDLALRAGLPLKILRRFRATREWTLQPGDLLYLPPRCAHDGVALTDCITCSIGFRAPDARELGARFLEYVADGLQREGLYQDPELRAQRGPARIGDLMVHKVQRMLGRIRWNRSDVERFLGGYLTEPKAHVTFSRPSRPLSARAFRARATRLGVRLALPTRMLYRHPYVFINGDACEPGVTARRLLARLANRRHLAPPLRPGPDALNWLYEWYRAGYILPGDG